MITVLAFVVVIGLLVLVHEFGHFIVAKKVGVPVDVFSVGFGPPIARKKLGETEYRLSAFPLGGYVKVAGMDQDHDRPDGYYSKPKWQRFSLIAAGPFFNLFLAIAIFALTNLFQGIPTDQPSNEVMQVLKGSPAESIGLQENDAIVAINGRAIRNGEEMVKIIHSHPNVPLTLKVRRGDKILTFRVTPKATQINGKKVGLIGFYPKPVMEKVGLFSSVAAGFSRTYSFTVAFLMAVPHIPGSIIRSLSGQNESPQIMGPVGIAKMAGQQAQQGVLSLLLFIAIISINLGLINLLPIPALDGGHLLFLAVETVRGRRLDPSLENKIHMVGFALLLILMVAVIVQDFVRGVPGAPRMP